MTTKRPFSWLRQWVSRHWRGEFSLPISFWINGVLLSLVILGLIGIGADKLRQEYALDALITLLLFYPCYYAIEIWQCIGIWRSATHHSERTARRLWPTLAKLSVLSSFITAGWTVATDYVPTLRIAYVQAQRESSYMYVVIPHDNGATIEVVGDFGKGLARELERSLDQNPNARVVRLWSPGGHMNEGRKVAKLIKLRGLNTDVPIECSSACVLAFLGGHERTLRQDAQLGFHATSPDGITPSPESQLRAEVDYLVAQGISPEFADRAMHAPPNELWYPAHETLLAEKIITAITKVTP